MPTVRYLITHGEKVIPLTPEEARIVIDGEIPRGLATIFRKKGLDLPTRGAIQYHLEITLPSGEVIRTQPYMRRLPDWPQAA